MDLFVYNLQRKKPKFVELNVYYCTFLLLHVWTLNQQYHKTTKHIAK